MYVELGPYLLGSQPTVNVHVADSRALQVKLSRNNTQIYNLGCNLRGRVIPI